MRYNLLFQHAANNLLFLASKLVLYSFVPGWNNSKKGFIVNQVMIFEKRQCCLMFQICFDLVVQFFLGGGNHDLFYLSSNLWGLPTLCF